MILTTDCVWMFFFAEQPKHTKTLANNIFWITFFLFTSSFVCPSFSIRSIPFYVKMYTRILPKSQKRLGVWTENVETSIHLTNPWKTEQIECSFQQIEHFRSISFPFFVRVFPVFSFLLVFKWKKNYLEPFQK